MIMFNLTKISGKEKKDEESVRQGDGPEKEEGVKFGPPIWIGRAPGLA